MSRRDGQDPLQPAAEITNDKGQLTDKDLERVVGGFNPQPDPPAGHGAI